MSSGRRHRALFLGLLLLVVPLLGHASDRSERPIGPGVRLLRWSRPEGPHALYAVEVDAENPFLRLGVSLGGGEKLALEPLSRQAERLTRPDRYPIAGVNGDFFYYPGLRNPGLPTSIAVLNGELIRTPSGRPCLVLDASGAPSIRTIRATGRVRLPDGSERTLDEVNHPRGAGRLVLFTPRYGASTRTSPEGTEVYLEPETFPLRPGVIHRARVLAVQSDTGDAPIAAGRWVLSGAGAAGAALRGLRPGDTLELRIDLDPPLGPEDQAIGGGPLLLRDGRIAIEDPRGTLNGGFATSRHPRTAVGFRGRTLYFVVADGRQPGYSVGMSLPELAEVMRELGCTDALNLDGGGSTTLWVRGAVVNRPSDGRERPVANGLFVFSTAPREAPVRLVVEPERLAALAGAEAPLSLTGEDRYYNPTPVPAAEARWQAPAEVGTVEGGRLRLRPDAAGDAPADAPRTVEIPVEWNGARGVLPVRVYARPARLELTPAAARVAPLGRVELRLRAWGAAGEALLLPADVRWEASPEIGAIEGASADSATLAASATPGRGTVRVTLRGVTAVAEVEVTAEAARPFDDFETDRGWSFAATPETEGSVAFAGERVRSGRRALRLRYDFSRGPATRAVYARTQQNLGQPFALRLWVYGDGQGAWLRARIRDGRGALHTLDLARRIDWSGAWRELRAPLSDDLPGPITLEAIYVVETDPARRPRGELLLDDLVLERG